MTFWVTMVVVLACCAGIVAFFSLRNGSEDTQDFVWRRTRPPNSKELGVMKALGLTDAEIDARIHPHKRPDQKQ
jgi:hypothetical protein